MPRDKRFIHSGCAVAAAVVVRNASTGVVNRSECWASAALPLIGGTVTANAGGVKWNNVLEFSGAQTVLSGGGSGKNDVVEDIQTAVDCLTIYDTSGRNPVLTADRVEIHAVLTFDRGSQKLRDVSINGSVMTASPYSNLRINGQSFSDIVLEADLADDAGKDHKKFRDKDLDARRKGKNHKDRLGKVYTTLAKDDKRLTSTDEQHGYLDVADFGRIYFAEWIEEEERQGLTGLRIFRDLPDSGEEMEITIADPFPLNGSFYP